MRDERANELISEVYHKDRGRDMSLAKNCSEIKEQRGLARRLASGYVYRHACVYVCVRVYYIDISV